MTADEWGAVCLLMDECWMDGLTKQRAAAYHTFLATYDANDVMLGLQKLARTGARSLPTVPEIIAAIETDESVPSWDEAWPLVKRALYQPDPDTALEQVAVAHPVVLGWARMYSWERLRMEPTNDPDHGGAVLRRLRDSYDDYIKRVRERVAAGRALDASLGRPALRGGALRQLDPAKALPAGPEVEQ